MDSQDLLEYQWPYILSFLPPEEVLERTAKETRALVRKRHVDSASTLLRLAFAYGFCGLTLRQTSAWAQVSDIANLSDVALLKRLRSSADWLGHLLYLKLTEKSSAAWFSSLPLHLRLVDATVITRPGSQGVDWRVHLGFNLAAMRIDHIELTDFTGGETLKRFPLRPNEVLLADRGYAQRVGLHAVRSAQAHF